MSEKEKKKIEENKSGLHLKSCRQFFKRTRDEQINNLCIEIYRALHPRSKNLPDFSNDAEYASWYHSLPDLAELLYRPDTYRKKTIKESGSLIRELEKKINALENLSSSRELSDFINSETYRTIRESPVVSKINKALDDKAISALRSLETGFEVLKEDSLKKIIADLKKQKDELGKAMAALEVEELCRPLKNVSVDIEYPIRIKDEDGVKRIDVLLSKDDRKFAIIELKQWTEDCINVFLSETEDEKAECLVNVLPGKKSQLHPAVKVRDYYKKGLLEEKGEDITVRCFVYLHNQLYSGSKLFDAYKEMKVNIFDDCAGANNILYTKLWHNRMLKRLRDLFDQKD